MSEAPTSSQQENRVGENPPQPAATGPPFPTIGRPLQAGEEIPAGCIVSQTPEGTMIFQSKEERKMYYRLQSEAKIPEPHATHRKLMKEIWINGLPKPEREALISEIVQLIVGEAENPYEAVLELHKYSCDYTVNSNDRLASIILNCFEKWLNKRDDRDQLEENFLNADIKKVAFDAATKVTTTSLAKIFDIFRIQMKNEEDVMKVDVELDEFIQGEIKTLCEQLKFKEAMEVVNLISWHERFDVELFLIPCTLQDRRPLVEEFLKKCPRLKPKYVQWLDELLPLTRLQVEEKFARYKQLKIMTLPIEQFLDKTLEKHIRRLLLAYRMGPAQAPNFTRSRVKGQIRYQINQFLEAEKTLENRYKYYQALYNNVKDDESMQKYMLINLVGEAVWWMLLLNIDDPYLLPNELKDVQRIDPGLIREKQKEVDQFRLYIEEQRDEAIPKVLHEDYAIHLVDSTKLELFQRLPQLLLEEELIGIDAEWKQGIASDTVALMQVACGECVYLIDFISLTTHSTSAQWRVFLEALLTGPGIKLGFDFGQDLKHLFDTFPNMVDLKSKLTNIVCLKQLTNNILDVNDQVIDVFDPSRPNQFDTYTTVDGEQVTERNFSLAYLYKQAVGKALDKTQQQSAWTQRPLTPKQILYAAQDAYCLHEIYCELQRRTERAGLHFENYLADCNPLTVAKKKKREKREVDDVEEVEKLVQEMNAFVASSEHPLRGCGELKLITDNMLTALGKYLRRMGVDVLLSNAKNDAFQLAHRHTDRILVSTGKTYTQLTNIKSLAGRTFRVPYGQQHPPITQAILIFKEFKILPKRSDVFSRCMSCNERAFVLVPRPILHFIYHFCFEIRGVYAREEDFAMEDWLGKLSPENLAAEKHGGVGATVDFIKPPYQMVAKCVNGEIHLGAGMVNSDNGMGPVKIEIHKYPSNVFITPGDRFFYVCGGCGHLYWDGYQRKNYMETTGGHIISNCEESDESQER
ncbi:unnamed protein product, partial [Mesorhabditis belari]|uniref:3'-5' exonuclease domain-containing protein n=1 Tax=Mesorhabditis belari TaxID=2138241 RepID=A0AAF3EEZ0_9BILA